MAQEIEIQPTPNYQDDDEDIALLNQQSNESPIEQFKRHFNMAQESVDLGRKYLKNFEYLKASKQFSKTVMTFQFVLKNNLKQSSLKSEIASMLKTIIIPSYSNLSLCYLHLEQYSLVLTFTNQVLMHESANVKNLYRRGVAYKMIKNYDEAIKDFELLKKIDGDMEEECLKLIKECKQLQKEKRRKQKQVAKNFIEGYSNSKPENFVKEKKKLHQINSGFINKVLKCVKNSCNKIFSMFSKQ